MADDSVDLMRARRDRRDRQDALASVRTHK
jgi:hypothetical protein